MRWSALFLLLFTRLVIAQSIDESIADLILPPAPSAMRVIPAFGVTGLEPARRLSQSSFDRGFAGALLADFGMQSIALESGILTLHSSVPMDSVGVNRYVQTWGFPVFGKYNFAGRPTNTFFVKAGGMPYWSNFSPDILDIMGVFGMGGTARIGGRYSLVVDVSYNRMLTAGSSLSNYHGFTMLAGLQIED